MRQQTKPFIVEIKQSRKLKTGNQKPSIWGKLDLSVADDPAIDVTPSTEPTPAEIGERV
ncbi:hypothetical protein AB4Z34_17645 [Ensifer sp. 2YAB10]|jgi:hypothetical protein|uniref:hypothetical protein n=1 Tax=unclassified Ensifer TaxID=2633371 RepID=UPI001A5CE148|nr:hypothetical protein [Ensifer sp. SSB1]MBK5570746.1 hypothetical protein [Ensifer sp. SSB1]